MKFKVDNEIKNNYLDYITMEYCDANLSVQQFVLERIDNAEALLDGKIYNFSKDNLMFLLSTFDAMSTSNLIVYRSIILQYLMYVSNIKTSSALYIVKDITMEDFESVINKIGRDRKYLTRKEYFRFLNKNIDIVNVQDLAIVVLLWNGIKGYQYNDLVNIKISDFDSSGFLICKDKIVELADIESKVLSSAINTSNYVPYEFLCGGEKVNKNSKKKPTKKAAKCGVQKITRYTLDEDCEYIIKPVIVDGARNQEGAYEIKMRLLKMLNYLDNNFLTGTSIYTSGVIYRMLEHYDFKILQNKTMNRYLDSNNIKTSRAKLKEMQRVMREKLIDEGSVVSYEEIIEKRER